MARSMLERGTGGRTGTVGAGAGAGAGWGYARIVGVAGAALFAAGGLWAVVDPEGFFDQLATFDPYNQHFIQDIGAFMFGLGAVLAIASWRPAADALAVALLGVGIGSGAHVVSHALGHDLGGEPTVDIPFFSIATVVLVTAGMLRWHDASRT
jgi:hypothetical protein